jgi:hypothetical protein
MCLTSRINTNHHSFLLSCFFQSKDVIELAFKDQQLTWINADNEVGLAMITKQKKLDNASELTWLVRGGGGC